MRSAPGSPTIGGTASASEQTPLLSRSSSETIRPEISAAVSGEDQDEDACQPLKHELSLWRGIAVAVSVWLLIFLQASNMSGMTMIQGFIARDLNAASSAMWFTSAFLIPMSSLAPVTGRLATIFAPRSLVLPLVLFIAVGAILCASAQSFAMFIVGRVVAGVGGAGVLTLAVVFVLELADEKRRGVFVGLVNAGFTMGVSFGAVVFGALMPVMGWRPLFWVQVPFAIGAGLGVYFSVPSSFEKSPKSGSTRDLLARIDYLGAALLVTTIVLFLYGLSDKIHMISLLVSIITLILFLVTEYSFASDPIIPLTVLSSRGVLLSCLAQLGIMSARWTVLFYTPIFMLAVRGVSPAAAGSVLIPANLVFSLGGIIVGWLHIRRGGSYWLPCVLSVVFFASSLILLSLVGTPNASIVAFFATAVFNGLVTGASMNYTLAHTLHHSHKDTEYVSTSLIATFRGFGGSFGTAIGGGIFYRSLSDSLTSGFLALGNGETLSPHYQRLLLKLLGSPELVFGGNLNSEEQRVAIVGYATALRSVWWAAAGLSIGMVLMQAATGWKSSRKEEQSVGEDERAVVN